jgi:hypothetical protein
MSQTDKKQVELTKMSGIMLTLTARSLARFSRTAHRVCVRHHAFVFVLSNNQTSIDPLLLGIHHELTARSYIILLASASTMTSTFNEKPKEAVSPSEYYRSWTAYDSLMAAAHETSYKSVWNVLRCDCCPEPHCWRDLPVVELPSALLARIRWYDHVRGAATATAILAVTTETESVLKEPSFESSTKGIHIHIHPSKLQPQPQPQSFLTDSQLHTLREHFVSHHQRIELILQALAPSLARVSAYMKQQVQHDPTLLKMTDADAVCMIQECQYAADGWTAVGRLVCGVGTHLNRLQYLHYVPSLAGVSGGNSPHMLHVSATTGSLEQYFGGLSDAALATAIRQDTPAGRVAQACMDLLDALSRCWLEHVVTATTSIGLTCGTQGTPNTTLVDRVLRRLYQSRLLRAFGSLRAPLTGIGLEMRQLHDYQTYPLAEHYLDVWDDPGCEFGTHSIGYAPTREYDQARVDFGHIRRTKRTKLWEHFYSETRPAFCGQLRRLLGLSEEEEAAVDFGLGSSVTEVLARIVASVQLLTPRSSSSSSSSKELQVLLADDEFVTFQRVAALLGQQGSRVTRLPAKELMEYVSQLSDGLSPVDAPHHDENQVNEEKKDHETTPVRHLVLVSLVNSCTQQIMHIDWALRLPLESGVVVVIDVTQAVANIPLQLEAWARRPNVFLIGSLIKVCPS